MRLFFILPLIYFSFFNNCHITPKFTLKNKERLKGMKVIQRLFKEGKSFSQFPLRVIYLETECRDAALQAGFTVSTRHFKHAVDRNRIKRLMRESYRLQKNPLADKLIKSQRQLAVFFIFTAAELPKYEEIFEKVGNALERIVCSIPEK